jgi:hypothetical protein
MAHLWVQSEGSWQAQRLGAAQGGSGDSLLRVRGDGLGGMREDAPSMTGPRLIWSDAGGSRAWALVTPWGSDVRVNGRAVVAGLRVLDDRDEIRTDDGARCYFSAEMPATVEEFPAPERPVFCGRCRQQIDVGMPAVRCPSCGVWYNQSAELPCWTYSDKCTFCGQATALDAGFAWAPED